MANLRILCVLIVLAAVCWEANASTSGAHWKIGKVTYKRGGHYKYYSIKSRCVRNIISALKKTCNGKKHCHVSAKSVARKSGCQVNKAFCLQVTMACHR